MTIPSLPGRPVHLGHKLPAPPKRTWWSWIGAALRARSASGGRACSLAVFDFSDLPEVHHTFGAAAARHLVARIIEVLGALDARRGRVLRTSGTTFAVVLPTQDAQEANTWIRDALGGSFAIECDWRGEEIVVVPDFLVRPLVTSDESFEVLHERMRQEIATTQQYAQRRDRYLRSEAESRCRASRSRRRPATAQAAEAAC